MAGDEGFKLASAYVEVKPDLSNFGAEAKAGVDSETKDLGATVPIGADTTDAAAKIADIRAKLDALKGDDPSPKVSVQIAQAEASAAQIEARIDRLNSIVAKPEVTLEEQAAYTELDELQAKLDELGHAMYSPKVEADTADTQAKIDEVNAKLDALEARDTEVRVKASADLMAAEAQLDALSLKLDEIGAKDTQARVGVDDGDSNAKLDEILAKLSEISKTWNAKLNIDTSGSGGEGGLSSLFSGGLFSPAGITGMALGGGAVLPALPGALTGAGAAAGVLGLAIAGTSTALSDYSAKSAAASTSSKQLGSSATSSASQIRTAQQAVSTAETQAAHDAITSAEAVKTAQQGVAAAETQAAHDAVTSAESIKNAQQGVATATQQASQNQISAEEQLKAAQYSEEQAQQALTAARQQAILTLQSLTNASADAALSVSQDQLNLQQAQLTASQTNASSTATALQKEQADLAVKEAEQALKEAIENRTNSAKASQTADKQGVNGNPAVLAAEHAQQQAKQGVADAQRNLANVEKAGAQAIAQAERSLADAIRSASWQRVADAQNVAKAQQGLSDASRNSSWTQQADAKNVANAQFALKAAYATAGSAAKGSYNSSAQAAATYAKAMSQLTPAGRQFVTTIIGMEGSLHKLEGVAQKALLPGLTALVKGIQSDMPLIGGEITKMGGLLSKGFSAIGKEMESSGFKKDLQDLFDEGNKFISILGPALNKFVLAFMDMGVKGGPALTGFAKMLSGILGGVDDLMKNLSEFSKAGGSIMITLGKAIGDLGGPLGTVIGTINSALAPLLKGMLPAFRQILQAIAGAVVAAGPGLIAFANSIAELMPALTPLISMLSGGLAVGLRLVGGLMQGFATFVKDNVTWLRPLTTLIVGVIGAVKLWTIAQAALDLVMAANPIVLVGIAIAGIVGGIVYAYTHFKIFRDAVHDVWAALQDAFGWVKSNWPLLLGILTGPFGLAVIAIVKFHTQIFDAIQTAWNAITSFFSGWWGNITGFFSTSLTGVELALSGAWDAVTSTLKSAWNAIASFFTGWWNNEVSGFKNILTTLGKALSDAWDSFTSAIKTAWNAIKSFFTGWWNDELTGTKKILGTIGSALSSAWSGIESTAKTVFGRIKSFFTGFWGDLKAGFRDAVSGVATAWDKIEKIMSTPVNWVISNVYDKLIVRFWNDIAGPVGLPKLAKLAGGGKLPGYGGGDIVPALLEPGETVVSKEHSKALAPAFRAAGVPGYAAGGIVSDIGGKVSSVWDGITGAIGETFHKVIGSIEHDLREGLALPMKAAGKVINAAASHVPGSSGMADAMKKAPAALWAGATKMVMSTTAGSGSGAGGTGKYTGHYGAGVSQWRPDVLKVLGMLSEPASLAGQVLYQMQTECVPVDYQILTRRGWLKHGDVRVGDETIGYNSLTGRSEWTRITDVHHYGEAQTVRYGNQYWSAECTPNHRWLTERIVRRPVGQQPLGACPECGATGGRRGPFPSQRSLQIHRAREHGVAGDRAGAPTAEVVAGTRLLALEDMTPQDRIVLARKASTGSSLDITTREAGLLGWIAGDDFVQEDAGRMTFAFSIYQSKTQFFRAIDYACGADPGHSRYKPRPGRKAHWKESTQWRLSTPYSRDLFRRAGHPKRDAVALVLAMSTEQRDAWLEALLLSEGCWSDGRVVYYQNAGEIADAIELAVYLSGSRPGRSERVRGNQRAVSIIETAPYVGGPSRRAQMSEAATREVWCPTTELGSWTARSDAGIFLTGNSGGDPNAINLSDSNAAAGDPSRGLLQTIMTTFEAYRSSKLPNNIYNPLANIYAAVNYAIHEYGRTLMRNGMGMGSGHGYDSGGYLQPGSTTAVNATGKPEAVLTPQESSAFVALAGSGGTSPLTSANSPLVRLNQTLVNPGGPIVVLNKTLTDPGGPMAYLQRTLANPGGPMVTLQKAIVNPGGPVSNLQKAIVNPGGPLTGLSKTIANPGGPMVDLKTTIANPGGPMVALTTALKNFNPGGPEKGTGSATSPVKLPGGKLGSTAGKGKPPIKATHPAGSGINPGGPNTPAGGASGAPVYNINVNYNGTKPSAEDHAAAMIRLSAAIGVA